MEIVLLADEQKMELAANFCIAYCGILSQHRLIATSATAETIKRVTGLSVEPLLADEMGGAEQVTSRVAYNEVDMVIFFRGTTAARYRNREANDLLRTCDMYNIPVATNLAAAEILVRALTRGDLDWRAIVKARAIIPPAEGGESLSSEPWDENTPVENPEG